MVDRDSGNRLPSPMAPEGDGDEEGDCPGVHYGWPPYPLERDHSCDGNGVRTRPRWQRLKWDHHTPRRNLSCFDHRAWGQTWGAWRRATLHYSLVLSLGQSFAAVVAVMAAVAAAPEGPWPELAVMTRCPLRRASSGPLPDHHAPDGKPPFDHSPPLTIEPPALLGPPAASATSNTDARRTVSSEIVAGSQPGRRLSNRSGPTANGYDESGVEFKLDMTENIIVVQRQVASEPLPHHQAVSMIDQTSLAGDQGHHHHH